MGILSRSYADTLRWPIGYNCPNCSKSFTRKHGLLSQKAHGLNRYREQAEVQREGERENTYIESPLDDPWNLRNDSVTCKKVVNIYLI